MLKPTKNKTFNSQSNPSQENGSNMAFDEVKKIDFISKWKRNNKPKVNVKGVMAVRTLIIVLVLLLICMYLLEKKYM